MKKNNLVLIKKDGLSPEKEKLERILLKHESSQNVPHFAKMKNPDETVTRSFGKLCQLSIS